MLNLQPGSKFLISNLYMHTTQLKNKRFFKLLFNISNQINSNRIHLITNFIRKNWKSKNCFSLIHSRYLLQNKIQQAFSIIINVLIITTQFWSTHVLISQYFTKLNYKTNDRSLHICDTLQEYLGKYRIIFPWAQRTWPLPQVPFFTFS